MSDEDARGPWAAQGIDLVRGACGGFLFAIPLLYTMEVWWTGSRATPEQSLGVLVLAFALVFLLNHTEGFRSTRDVRLADALADSLTAVALGVVMTTAILVLTREVTADTSTRDAIGKVSYQVLPFCLGVGVARHYLRQGRDEDDSDDGRGSRASDAAGDTGLDATLADVGATTLGAVFVGLNIAPTDEVQMLASALDPIWVLAVALVSLLISYGIVFVAGFVRQDRRRAQTGVLQHPVTETVMCYLVSLFAAWSMLAVFHRHADPDAVTLANVVVLGLPAAIGGAAGRLAI